MRIRHAYWLFTGLADRAEGGVDDLGGTFLSLDDALAYAATWEQDHRRTGAWYQLVNVTTAHVVRARRFQAGWYDYERAR